MTLGVLAVVTIDADLDVTLGVLAFVDPQIHLVTLGVFRRVGAVHVEPVAFGVEAVGALGVDAVLGELLLVHPDLLVGCCRALLTRRSMLGGTARELSGR